MIADHTTCYEPPVANAMFQFSLLVGNLTQVKPPKKEKGIWQSWGKSSNIIFKEKSKDLKLHKCCHSG